LLEQRIKAVIEKIAKAARVRGTDPTDITLVAVSKTVDIEVIKRAFELGISNFGENRVKELRTKMNLLPGAKWHLIGRIQTNKVREITENICLIHSLDRWNLAEELNRRGERLGSDLSCLLQVNIAREEQKAGVAPNDIRHFLDSVGQLKRLRILGLMTMAPIVDQAEEARPIFRELYAINTELQKSEFNNVQLKYLSMGMSQDYEIAVQEGANIVRIGGAIFNDY
jgi:pyridoxal phosphate enzyme (YggS family)